MDAEISWLGLFYLFVIFPPNLTYANCLLFMTLLVNHLLNNSPHQQPEGQVPYKLSLRPFAPYNNSQLQYHTGQSCMDFDNTPPLLGDQDVKYKIWVIGHSSAFTSTGLYLCWLLVCSFLGSGKVRPSTCPWWIFNWWGVSIFHNSSDHTLPMAFSCPKPSIHLSGSLPMVARLDLGSAKWSLHPDSGSNQWE